MDLSDWLFKPRSTNATKRFTRSGDVSRLRLESLEDRLVPASTISINNVAVALGASSAGFTLTRTGDTSTAIQVDYTTTNGTATAGINYTPTSGTVTFASGQTTATLSVPLPIANFMGSSLSFSVELTGVTVLSSVPASFTSQATSDTGNDPYGVTVADINGDGELDLIVANASDGTVSVLMNATAPGATAPTFAGQQTFQTDPTTTGSNPQSVKMADINGDGKPDLIVANEATNTVSVLLNTTPTGATTPSFAQAVTFPTVGSQPYSVAVADLNGDGKPDLVVANKGNNTVSVLLNTTATGATTPTFTTAVTFPTGGSQPFSVAVADLNGDGKPDIVVANKGNNTVSVLLNTTATGATTPSFAAQQTFNTGSQPFSVAVADLNGDGKPDIVVANNGNNTVSVLLNTTAKGAATASFAAQQTFNTGSQPFSVAVTDLNGDGKPDIVISNNGGGAGSTVSVLLNMTATGAATASFAAQQTFNTGNGPQGVRLADINNDGASDIIVANGSDATVSVLTNLDVTNLGSPGTATITNSATEVQLLTTTAGDLYRIDATGVHFVFGGIIADASAAYEPSGEVELVTTTAGDLYRLDSTGIHFVVGGIIAGASIAYEPTGEVDLVTTKSGSLYRLDSTGAHLMYGGLVAGASITFEPSGEVILVTTTTGDLYRLDSTGAHLVVGGIVAGASIAYGPSGEVALVTTTTGDLYEFDATGVHLMFGGIIESANVADEP